MGTRLKDSEQRLCETIKRINEAIAGCEVESFDAFYLGGDNTITFTLKDGSTIRFGCNDMGMWLL